MGSGEADLLEDAGGGGGGGGGEGGGGGMTSVVSSSSPVSCSICLEVVTDNGERSRAKLYCGHVFHLDCIGSAFNAKGVMQCPNCRKIEKGQWLYANGCHSFPELRMEDWPHDEDLYDHLSYSEMSFGVHWCPFSGLTRVPSSFEKQGFWPSWPPGEDSFDSEEGESPSAAYHDLLGHRAIFAEHTAASSVAHSCPYVAYFQPVHSSSSNSSESVADGLSFSHHWNGLSASNDISTSHPFPSMDLHYHGWEHHPPSFSPSSSHISGADQAPNPAASLRSNRGDSDGIPRSGSFVRPILLSNGSGPRAGSSVISSMVPPYSSMNSRGHERIPGLRPYQQQPNSSILPPIHPSVRRSSGSRGLAPPVGPVAPSSDHTSGYILYPSSGSSGRSLQEAENPQRNRFYAWERDRFAPFPLIPIDRESSWWGPFPQASSGSDSSSRASNFWHRHGSERSSSQSRSENPPYQPVHPSGRMMHPFI